MPTASGRHFLHIPGPTNVPDRVLRALSRQTIDHRGPAFARLTKGLLGDLQQVFRTDGAVVIYPSSGSGAWEAALVNTLSPGERVLMFETGHFALAWARMAKALGLDVELVAGDWRSGVDPDAVSGRLEEDREHRIAAVAMVHNETSTGVASRVAEIRAAIDRAGHPALLLVDAVSSLGCMDYRHDEWQVDVTVSASQKGLMLPPGLGFTAISDKARARSATARLPRSYWDWEAMLAANAAGSFPYTPATNLLYGLREALDLLFEQGLDQVFARHRRHAAATRAAVAGWGLEVVCRREDEHSAALTAVLLGDGHDADALRTLVLERYDLSLGGGLSKLAGRVVRIGHLGDLNDLMLCGALSGVELGLRGCGIPLAGSGVAAALDYLQHPPGG